MNKIKSTIAISAILISALPVAAQHTASGYFNDGYLFRHEMNPAISNEQSYVTMPTLNNVNVAMRGNLRVDEVLFNRNGKTTTFLNPDVSTAEFMSGIDDKNQVSVDLKLQLFGLGFKGFKGYNHIGFNVRSNIGMSIPGDLFSLAKEGVSNRDYDIGNFNTHVDAYAEISLGHSHKINDRLDIGASVKFLLGGANIDAEFEKAKLSLNNNQWTAVTNAKIQASIKGFTYEEETTMRGADGQQRPHTYVSGMDVDGGGLNGFGLAIDLGAVYTLNDNWRLSAALLDLGFISWKNNMMASTNGDQTFTTDTYLFNVDDDADNSFERESDRMAEGLAALYELHDNGDQGSRSTGLASTLNLGAEYTLSAYKKLSFGLLNTTRFNGDYSWTNFRLSANWKPTNIFSMGANLAAGTYGTSFGWILNFHPNGFNVFLAMDHTFGKLAKQGVPLSGNGHVNFGVNFPF